ncbi:hypothetical protein IP92_05477 [Pseudoduganella flava]|uniref:Uncharacterized protein n=2 Tax=Pseudoduganella flava TaxID=871742 RepID=A0A562PDJ1_9BURK|nr:hypothetical protein [Pseudoduganella flava]TWI42501.1 hypothetical protein IP92_05477 [Pseudoduganella flava]
MKSDLRNNPQRSMGRYWLAMSDAAAFTLVRSALAIAAKLRAGVAEQVHVVPPLSGPELAVALLTAADAGWGKGKATHLMAELADLKGVDCLGRAKAWTLLRDAVAELPTGLWALEKQALRRELLDELERQANAAKSELPPLPSKVELREQQWRETALALRAAARQ